MNERRWAVLLVSPELLVEMCKWNGVQRFYINGNQLPQDAKMVGAGEHRGHRWDADYAAFAIIVESATFDPVPEGNILPILNPVMFKRDTDAA